MSILTRTTIPRFHYTPSNFKKDYTFAHKKVPNYKYGLVTNIPADLSDLNDLDLSITASTSSISPSKSNKSTLYTSTKENSNSISKASLSNSDSTDTNTNTDITASTSQNNSPQPKNNIIQNLQNNNQKNFIFLFPQQSFFNNCLSQPTLPTRKLSLNKKITINSGNLLNINKFNSFVNLYDKIGKNENTEILKVKIKVSDNNYKIFILRRYDDLYISLCYFFKNNNINNYLLFKAILFQIFASLNKIYTMMNSRVDKREQIYLKRIMLQYYLLNKAKNNNNFYL